MLDIKSEIGSKPAIKVTAMPGQHVKLGMLQKLNDLVGAVSLPNSSLVQPVGQDLTKPKIPPTNGWMLELGTGSETNFKSGYRIYISGDTLMVDEVKEIPERYKGQNIDLMLIHLGGTTIPSPKMPSLMVTMDANQGLELVRLINPDLTIPIHYDDYDVFLSPLDDFKREVEKAGLSEKVVYLDRKDMYKFKV